LGLWNIKVITLDLGDFSFHCSWFSEVSTYCRTRDLVLSLFFSGFRYTYVFFYANFCQWITSTYVFALISCGFPNASNDDSLYLVGGAQSLFERVRLPLVTVISLLSAIFIRFRFTWLILQYFLPLMMLNDFRWVLLFLFFCTWQLINNYPHTQTHARWKFVDPLLSLSSPLSLCLFGCVEIFTFYL